MLTGQVPLVQEVPLLHIQLLPVYSLITFGVISAAIVLYRTFTFNNCDDAATELKSQIEEAKTFFKKKGLSVADN